MQNKNYLVRNVCIGLIDGIIIPLALTSGLSYIAQSSYTIFLSAIVVACAGAITMTFSAYVEGKRYEPSQADPFSALLVGLGYLSGGLMVASPYLFIEQPPQAFLYAGAVSFVVLIAAGYIESFIHGASGWTGAVRVLFTASAAAGAAYLVGKWFF